MADRYDHRPPGLRLPHPSIRTLRAQPRARSWRHLRLRHLTGPPLDGPSGKAWHAPDCHDGRPLVGRMERATRECLPSSLHLTRTLPRVTDADVHQDEHECTEMAKSVLARHLGIEEEPVATRATIQRNCIPQYLVGHTSRMAQLAKAMTKYVLN